MKFKKDQDQINEFCKLLLSISEHLKYCDQEHCRLATKLESYQKTIENLRIGFYKDLVNMENHNALVEVDAKNRLQSG